MNNTYYDLDAPLHLHSLKLSVRNNVFKVHAPSDYIEESGPLRILIINDSANIAYRMILGYIVIVDSSLNPLLVWTKPTAFQCGIIPDIYRPQTLFGVCVRYEMEFHTVINLYLHGLLWEATEIFVTENRIIATRNIIAYYCAENHLFETFNNEDCSILAELKEASKKFKSPPNMLDGNYAAIGMQFFVNYFYFQKLHFITIYRFLSFLIRSRYSSC